MISKNRLTQFANHSVLSAFLFMLVCALIVPVQAQAKSDPFVLPSLNAFAKTVKNGDARVARGVYVPRVMALPVVQQPEGDFKFVSKHSLVVTQFSLADKFGNIGLLAHNTLAGKLFFNIAPNDQIVIVYGDGRMETFLAESVLRYQALPQNEYKDLKTKRIVSAKELIKIAYRGKYHVALQTCIAQKGDFNWGILFVIAKPLVNQNAENNLLNQIKAPLTLGWPLLRRN